MYIHISIIEDDYSLQFHLLFTPSATHEHFAGKTKPALVPRSQIYIFQSAIHCFLHFAIHLERFCMLLTCCTNACNFRALFNTH